MSKTVDIVMLAIENTRSKAYLQRLLGAGLSPSFVILMKDEAAGLKAGQRAEDVRVSEELRKEVHCHEDFAFYPNISLEETLSEHAVPHEVLSTMDVNSQAVIAALQKRHEELVIFSAAGGAILRSEILGIGKKFLHVHPGLLPEFRGSTTIYYSLLKEGNCGATAIFLNAKIDQGDVIASRRFEPPKKRTDIDYLYDPFIRSALMLEVVGDYARGKLQTKKQSPGGQAYYIIHPVLKHICILES